MFLIYTHKITNRLRYIFDFIFKEQLGCDFALTTDKEEFIHSESMKVNYSSRRLADELFFYPTPLLFERGIKKQNIKIGYQDTMPIFFISSNNSDLTFDLFAASFYLITRYEEYFPDKPRDRYGRFPAKASLAYRHNFLQKPLIDIWIKQLTGILQKYYPDWQPSAKTYKFIPTYDIDIAYAYSNKGFLRNLGGYLRDLKQFQWTQILDRTKVMLGQKLDPFDTFDWLSKLRIKYQLSPVYFFLIGDYGPLDKNISIYNLTYQDLIQSIGDYCNVGIHPSFASNKDVKILSQEIDNLASVLKKEIINSRQHYIMLNIPLTYQNLLEVDVIKDFSMGYPSEIGFRASTASAFYFYDLTLEMKTKLKVYPFAVMDVTLKNYMGLNTSASLEAVKELIAETKAVNGLFMTLWHNHTLSDLEGWKGWKATYEEVVKMAIETDS